jgi:hypothetical protein
MKVLLNSNNFTNSTANITFVPSSNPSTSINIGSQTIPYLYNSSDIYGTYTLYFPLYDKTCSVTVAPTNINTIGMGNGYLSIIRYDQSDSSYGKIQLGNTYMSILRQNDINTSSDIYEKTKIGNTYVSILNSDPV